jgi:hypothetical protein
MYIPFWPEPGPNNAKSPLLPINSGTPYPAGVMARSRAAIQRVSEGAALGYRAAQTVGPGMDAGLLNSTGQGTPALPAPDASMYQNAPAVVPLNPSSWTAPLPAMASCGDSFNASVPWADALYSSAPGFGDDGGVLGWLKKNPGLSALAVTGALLCCWGLLGAVGDGLTQKR